MKCLKNNDAEFHQQKSDVEFYTKIVAGSNCSGNAGGIAAKSCMCAKMSDVEMCDSSGVT